MKALSSSAFAVPKAPPRTALSERAADAFVSAERPASVVAALAPSPREAPARLSVDVPPAVLRALKIRAIGRGITLREYVLELLAKDGIGGE